MGNAGAGEVSGERRKCAENALLQEGDHPESAMLRWLSKGEEVDVLEGPVEVFHEPGVVLQGTAVADGASGWFVVQDSSAEVFASGGNMFVCKVSIAMTDGQDAATSKILRKVAKGEALQLVGETMHRSGMGGGTKRQKFLALSDGTEGWVTVTGAHGTAFLVAKESYFVVQKPRMLWRGDMSPAGAGDAELVRPLEVGEAFEAWQEAFPVEALAPRMAAYVRAVGDGAAGWVSWPKSSAELLVAEGAPKKPQPKPKPKAKSVGKAQVGR